ncbi:hypothetical protein [Nocardioides marmoribigeumensis]|jgi:hypothetical protein|uniref:Uncharacterized protein n=1 Tax=Nocardioides marmoribigeumensis TaxID=433649 RepID=A0ABU2BTE5_9ACTN|nr:hypothetical protein [Nocardioides marmoribigeumensis]MDR7361906.1 hypothetical protein [Nocardioides marmoribigeumensis]
MSMPVTMTTDEIARARSVFLGDQARAARHARTEASATATARVLVALYLALGAYAVLAVLGILPAAAWSALR